MNSLRISALAVALTALASVPAFAQPNAAHIPDLSGTEFDRPDATVYSWGVLDSPADGPQVKYFWSDVNRRLIRSRSAVPTRASAQSAGVNTATIPDLRGTEFDRPDATVYSWGVLDSPADGPQIQYFWGDVNRRLAAAGVSR
jgi:hypothetical protein